MNIQNMKPSGELKENNFDKKIEDYQDKLVVIYKRIQELKRRQNMKFKKSSGRVKRYYCSYCGSPITYDDYIKYNGLCFPCYCE